VLKTLKIGVVHSRVPTNHNLYMKISPKFTLQISKFFIRNNFLQRTLQGMIYSVMPFKSDST